MTLYAARRGVAWEGREIGILTLDERIPRVPGSVGHAGSFSYPVRYRRVAGATVGRLVKNHDRDMEALFVAAARELQAEGVSAVTGCCGFMALFQRAVASALEIPALLSSLLQLPMIAMLAPQNKRIGIITASSESLTPDLLRGAGIETDISKLCVYGLENEPEARGALLEEKGTLDDERMRAEVLGVAKKMLRENDGIAAVLLECSELPPYSLDVQRAVGLPVFDFVTMIDYLHTALTQRAYDPLIRGGARA